jgi:hypothetical protein
LGLLQRRAKRSLLSSKSQGNKSYGKMIWQPHLVPSLHKERSKEVLLEPPG